MPDQPCKHCIEMERRLIEQTDYKNIYFVMTLICLAMFAFTTAFLGYVLHHA